MQETLFAEPEEVNPISNHEMNTEITLDKGVLKSGLQKAIRQRRPEEAVRIMKSFLALDRVEALRRFPVIIMEDVLIHPETDEIVNLYRRVGKKAYFMTDEERDMVLRVTWEVAETEWRDFWWKCNPYAKLPYDIMLLTPKMKALYEAVEYRASAGGLAEDPLMMRSQMHAWYHRWSMQGWDMDDIKAKFNQAPAFGWNDVEYARLDDIPLNTFDFHLMGATFNRLIAQKPHVTSAISRLFPNKDPQFVVMNLVWRNWVAINPRVYLEVERPVDWFTDDGVNNAFPVEDRESMEELWELIKNDVRSLSTWVRSKRGNRNQ